MTKVWVQVMVGWGDRCVRLCIFIFINRRWWFYRFILFSKL